MDEYRKKIDEIDKKLAVLLNERLDVVEQIGMIKKRRCLSILDEEREEERRNFFEEHTAPGRRVHMRRIIDAIMAESRAYQQTPPRKEPQTVGEEPQAGRPCSRGLLGRGLSHSLSPRVHELLGGYDFGLIDVEPEDLDRFFEEGNFAGLSVTMPYKREVIGYCDRLSGLAREIGSVNTIVREDDGSLTGHNTDYDGFKYTVEKSGVEIHGAKCIIFGSGGVSGTVEKVLRDMGAGQVVIVSRGGEDNYENLRRHLDAEVIVNATPVGMYPEEDVTVLSQGATVHWEMANNGDCQGAFPGIVAFQKCRGLFDLIYNPLRTRLMLEAEEAGIPAFGGLDMLVFQAARACELFTGQNAAENVAEVRAQIARESENIVLIGMPGCGKTEVGKRLAQITGKEFIDTDDMIEKAWGEPAGKIIENLGEEVFRDREEDAVRKACRLRNCVIATGGGVVERSSNRRHLRRNGRLVYLVRDIEDIACEGRPLSMEKGVAALFAKRESRYIAWADFQVANIDPAKAAEEIAGRMGYL